MYIKCEVRACPQNENGECKGVAAFITPSGLCKTVEKEIRLNQERSTMQYVPNVVPESEGVCKCDSKDCRGGEKTSE